MKDVITVSRQLGSAGDDIAEKVAKAMGYVHVDRRLVEEIANITDTSAKEVEKYDEKGEGRVQHFLKRLLVPEMGSGRLPLSSASYFPEFGLEFPYALERENSETAGYLDRGTYQLLITTLIQDYGDTGKAVIVGRASQAILSGHKNAVHVKIVAPVRLRCERVMEARDVDYEQAAELIEQHDRWRELYLDNFHGADWNDVLMYDLIINTGRMPTEEASDLIVHYLDRDVPV